MGTKIKVPGASVTINEVELTADADGIVDLPDELVPEHLPVLLSTHGCELVAEKASKRKSDAGA